MTNRDFLTKFDQNLTHMGRFDGELSKLCFSYNTFSQKLFTIPSRKKLWRLLRNKLIYWLYLNKFLVFKYLVIGVTSVGLNYCCHTPWHRFIVIFPGTAVICLLTLRATFLRVFVTISKWPSCLHEALAPKRLEQQICDCRRIEDKSKLFTNLM